MLETLAALAGLAFLLGLLIFAIRLGLYISSGRYELDQRIDRYCK